MDKKQPVITPTRCFVYCVLLQAPAVSEERDGERQEREADFPGQSSSDKSHLPCMPNRLWNLNRPPAGKLRHPKGMRREQGRTVQSRVAKLQVAPEDFPHYYN